MKINLNGKKYNLKALSELTFTEFNKVLIKAKVSGLDEYLAIFLDIEKENILGAKIKSHTIEAIHKFIFDIDVLDKVKNPPKAFEYNGSYLLKDELNLDTFGKAYYYDLYYQRYKAGQLNEYQLSMYALSVALTDSLDDKIETIYNELCGEKWTKYLPTAFFLLKKFRKPKRHSVMLLIRFTLGLRAIRWRIRLSRKKLIRWAKI